MFGGKHVGRISNLHAVAQMPAEIADIGISTGFLSATGLPWLKR